jgi:S1-C subfamily serine protease
MIKKLCILWIILCSSAIAGSLHESIEDEKYLEFGNKFDCVVQLEIYEKSPNIMSLGSGVIINNNWILTSAHGLTNTNKVIAIIDNNRYQSTKIIPHKDFKAYEGKYDIALVKVPHIKNFDKFPTLNTDTDLLQRNVMIAGFGLVCRANDTSEQKYDGKRRAGSNTSIDLEDHMIICEMNSNDYSELEFLLNSGDSGGGLFLKGDLAGINSCIIATDGKADGSYGDKSGHTRVDLFLDWIRENMKD